MTAPAFGVQSPPVPVGLYGLPISDRGRRYPPYLAVPLMRSRKRWENCDDLTVVNKDLPQHVEGYDTSLVLDWAIYIEIQRQLA